MKSILGTLFAAALVTAPALAASGWHNDFEAARKLAAKENKDLLLGFTGSDWCSWCIRLKKEVFDHEAFEKGVAGKFVLVELDYPRDKSILPEAILKQNAALKAEYGVPGYPTIFLCDAKGRPYAQTGYKAGGPEAYVRHLGRVGRKRAARDAAFAKAEKAEGEGRAVALEEALTLVPQGVLATIYKREFDELGTLAADSKLVTTVKAAESERRQRVEFRDFFTRKEFEAAAKHADELIKSGNLDGEEKQQVLFYKMNAYMALSNYDDVLKVIDEIKEVAPDSRLGSGAERFRQHIEDLKAKKPGEKPKAGSGEKRSGSKKPAGETPVPNRKGASLAPSRPTSWLIAQEKPVKEKPAEEKPAEEKPAEEKPAEEKPVGEKPAKEKPAGEAGGGPGKEGKRNDEAGKEAKLKKAIAESGKKLAAVTRKIAADHENWEKTEKDMDVTRKRISELQATLENEQAKLVAMERVVAKFEKEHNSDHDLEEVLQKQVEERRATLKEFESKQDEITKLEKEAAELRKKAEALRKRAGELKKN